MIVDAAVNAHATHEHKPKTSEDQEKPGPRMRAVPLRAVLASTA